MYAESSYSDNYRINQFLKEKQYYFVGVLVFKYVNGTAHFVYVVF